MTVKEREFIPRAVEIGRMNNVVLPAKFAAWDKKR